MLVDRKPVTLDTGHSISRRRVSSEDGERSPQFEYTEEYGITPAEEIEDGKETGRR
jgi:hypothetical protein